MKLITANLLNRFWTNGVKPILTKLTQHEGLSAGADKAGHVKLSDTYNSVLSGVTGVAASQKALAQMYTASLRISSTFTAKVTVDGTTDVIIVLDLSDTNLSGKTILCPILEYIWPAANIGVGWNFTKTILIYEDVTKQVRLIVSRNETNVYNLRIKVLYID
jgi:hypothetical protein